MKWDLESNSGKPVEPVMLNEIIWRFIKDKVKRKVKASETRHAIELFTLIEIIKDSQRCQSLIFDII